MKTVIYEATVENGEITIPAAVHLPEHTKVFVVVPGDEVVSASSTSTSARERFTVAYDDDGLPIIRTTGGVISSRFVKEIET